ncbi:MAG: hypothetical protein HY721_26755 [Planctomycetes bacterium]|nr:hypothetical protein [Planctomycetota bacterium]
MSTPIRTNRRRIGEILVNEGVVSQEQVEAALDVQRKSGGLLGTILMDMGIVTESDIAKTISVQYQLPFICLANYELDEKLVGLFPREFLHKHKLLPFDKIGDTLLIMVSEIPQDSVLAEIPKLTQLNAALYVGYYSEVTKHLETLAPLDGQPPPKAMGKGPSAKPAAAPAGPVPVREAAPLLEISDGGPEGEEEAPLAADGDEGDLTDEGETLVFNEGKSFLEELDSTWNTIFEEATEEKADKQVKPGKPAAKPGK